MMSRNHMSIDAPVSCVDPNNLRSANHTNLESFMNALGGYDLTFANAPKNKREGNVNTLSMEPASRQGNGGGAATSGYDMRQEVGGNRNRIIKDRNGEDKPNRRKRERNEPGTPINQHGLPKWKDRGHSLTHRVRDDRSPHYGHNEGRTEVVPSHDRSVSYESQRGREEKFEVFA